MIICLFNFGQQLTIWYSVQETICPTRARKIIIISFPCIPLRIENRIQLIKEDETPSLKLHKTLSQIIQSHGKY